MNDKTVYHVWLKRETMEELEFISRIVGMPVDDLIQSAIDHQVQTRLTLTEFTTQVAGQLGTQTEIANRLTQRSEQARRDIERG